MIEAMINASIGSGPPIPSITEILFALAAVVGGWSAFAFLCFWYFFRRPQ
jgi:hypothetical protein